MARGTSQEALGTRIQTGQPLPRQGMFPEVPVFLPIIMESGSFCLDVISLTDSQHVTLDVSVPG